ncbi:flagellar basal body-associated FliL family protein [bacterium]|nr:flagellar basal body-associated FliL family protein [bacterium]
MAGNTNEQTNKSSDINKFLIISLVSTVLLCVIFAGVNYVVVDNLVSQKISKINFSQETLDDSEDAVTDEIARGIVVDLGDFILNLCDETQKKYLKVNVAIEVTQKETDFPKEEAKSKGGHGHGEAPTPVDPMELIQQEMNQYKPAIRDAVITNLSSKTSAELASTAGKELAKEQIANDVNSILAGEREVLRVSFGQFIIQ